MGVGVWAGRGGVRRVGVGATDRWVGYQGSGLSGAVHGAGNNIGDEGALGLAEAVKTNTTLQTLDLGGEWTDVLVGWSGGRCVSGGSAPGGRGGSAVARGRGGVA